jgi:hypothetical protein
MEPARLKKLEENAAELAKWKEALKRAACPFRKSHPHILVVQSGQDRNGNDLPARLNCSV